MRDAYHDIVITALQKDGWFITHDPFIIPAGKKEIQIDLGAERLVAAQKLLQLKLRASNLRHTFTNFIGPLVNSSFMLLH